MIDCDLGTKLSYQYANKNTWLDCLTALGSSCLFDFPSVALETIQMLKDKHCMKTQKVCLRSCRLLYFGIHTDKALTKGMLWVEQLPRSLEQMSPRWAFLLCILNAKVNLPLFSMK